MALEDVKKLRDTTGAGLMDCKNALSECNGDLEAAVKLLKEKGLAAMVTREGRPTTEGKVFMSKEDGKIVYASVSCETDFVSKSNEFGAIQDVISLGEEAIKGKIDDLKVSIRENMKLQAYGSVEVPENCGAGCYVHSDGKTAAIVVIEGASDTAVEEFAYDCCLHLAAYTPKYIQPEDVPADYIKEQEEIIKARVSADPKLSKLPEHMLKGVLSGKIKKHLSEICFTEQAFVKDDSVSVAFALTRLSKKLGKELKFKEIVQITPGECSVKEN